MYANYLIETMVKSTNCSATITITDHNTKCPQYIFLMVHTQYVQIVPWVVSLRIPKYRPSDMSTRPCPVFQEGREYTFRVQGVRGALC